MPIEFKIRNLTVIDLNCLFDSALFEANKYALDNDIKSSKDISTLFKHFTFTKFLDVCQNFTTKNILLYFEDQSDLPKDYFLILKLLKIKLNFQPSFPISLLMNIWQSFLMILQNLMK